MLLQIVVEKFGYRKVKCSSVHIPKSIAKTEKIEWRFGHKTIHVFSQQTIPLDLAVIVKTE